MTLARRATKQELECLYRAFANTNDPEVIEALMDDLCTKAELHEMAQRLKVAFMLNAGDSYLAIQEATGASATTIARVSKCLNYGSGGYRTVIDQEQQ